MSITRNNLLEVLWQMLKALDEIDLMAALSMLQEKYLNWRKAQEKNRTIR